jgi:hypothetical protein
MIAISLLHSCAPKYSRHLASNNTRAATSPDYSNGLYWAAHPAIYDPSDSIPEPLKKNYSYDSTVDVFFLHPTTFTSKENPFWNADLNDGTLNRKTDYSTILFQSSVFNEYRVFAPRYRQAHIRSYYSNEPSAKNAFDTAYEDVRNAFKYYLASYNNGRPIIIASHSQGTTHAIRLLKEFFQDNFLSDQLVAAYLVGMYIPSNYFSSLPVCKDSIQIGCFCGWRSFQNGFIPQYVKKEKEASVVVNPLTWTTTGEYASKQNNKGAVLRNFNKVFRYVADAKISSNVLWISKPNFPGSFFLRMRNYHIADINFFYINIRENLRARVKNYKIQKKMN